MKKLLSILIFIIAFGCQNPPNRTNNQSTTDQGTTEFVFQEELHNFGSLQAGEIVAYSFQFNNTGTKALIIERAESDCGCITVEFPSEEINSGESGYVEIIFNSAGEVGKVYKEIKLISNAEDKETILSITANVKNELINIYTKN